MRGDYEMFTLGHRWESAFDSPCCWSAWVQCIGLHCVETLRHTPSFLELSPGSFRATLRPFGTDVRWLDPSQLAAPLGFLRLPLQKVQLGPVLFGVATLVRLCGFNGTPKGKHAKRTTANACLGGPLKRDLCPPTSLPRPPGR